MKSYLPELPFKQAIQTIQTKLGVSWLPINDDPDCFLAKSPQIKLEESFDADAVDHHKINLEI